MGFLKVLGNIGKAIAPGLFGVGQSMIESGQQRKNLEMQNKANMELAKFQYNKDLEMWNKANEYNSPKAQMDRYIGAGLNPNLIYGTGSASAGNTSTSLPKYNAPTLDYSYKAPVDITSLLRDYQDYSIRQAQVSNLREDNRIKRLQGNLLFFQNSLWEPDAVTDKMEKRPVARRLAEYNMEIKQKTLESIEQSIQEKLLGNILKQKGIKWYTAKSISQMLPKFKIF